MDKDTQNRLLREARDGDMNAFATLFEEWRPMIHAVATRMVGPDEADDVVMETFLKAWRALPKFNARASLKTWLYRICNNCCLDFLRKRKRRRERVMPEDEADERQISDLQDDSQPAADENLLASEQRQLLQQALAQMDETHRNVLLLHYAEDMSTKDIAAATGVSLGTVLSRLFNGRKKLRKKLQELT